MNILEKNLKKIKTLALTGHVRPDGDCIGSILALYNYVKSVFPDIEARIFLEAPPKKLNYLNGFKDVEGEFPEDYTPDLIICLDAADKERLGFTQLLFDKAKMSLCIDHHITNTLYAGENHVEAEASSTCEVLYGLLQKDNIDKAVAECLYTGIIHDTGVFRHSCTSPKTMEIAADLMKRGIDFGYIINEGFYTKTYLQNQITGRALLESVTFADGKCLFSSINKKIMDFYGVSGQDLDGIVSQLSSTEGVELAIFLYELEPSVYKVSMRSHHIVDVSALAKFFGGGGHVRAAGCTMVGTVHDIINNISAKVFQTYKEL